MEMAERGETPAGIQQVESRLSHDVADGRGFPSADRLSSSKPWEKDQGEGAAGAAAAAAAEAST